MASPTRIVIAFSCVTLLLAASPRPSRAQAPIEVRLAEAGEMQELRLADGSTLVGHVVDTGDPIHFEWASGGTIEVYRVQIRELHTVEGELHDGELWGRDPSANRLFFGPTERTIGAGRGFLAVFEGFFPSVCLGLSDRVTMGGGTLLLGDVGTDSPFWLVPNVQVFDAGRTAVSVGALAVFAGEGSSAGILYGVATHGGPDAALTVGIGYNW